MNAGVTDKHRLFLVNDKLEFALFYDPNIKDKDTIINTFLSSRDWKWYESYFEVKVSKTEISKDLRTVSITVIPKK